MNKFRDWIQRQNKIIQAVIKCALVMTVLAILASIVVLMLFPVGEIIIVALMAVVVIWAAWLVVQNWLEK